MAANTQRNTDMTELSIDLAPPKRETEPLKNRIGRLWHNWRNRKVARAMRILTAEMEKDHAPGSYYDSWVANIAMPLYDRRGELDIHNPDDCRKFAHDLMQHFFGK